MGFCGREPSLEGFGSTALCGCDTRVATEASALASATSSPSVTSAASISPFTSTASSPSLISQANTPLSSSGSFVPISCVSPTILTMHDDGVDIKRRDKFKRLDNQYVKVGEINILMTRISNKDPDDKKMWFKSDFNISPLVGYISKCLYFSLFY